MMSRKLMNGVLLGCTIALASGCDTNTPRPRTPPTFVMAYTDGASVRTMQSVDGAAWVLPATMPGPGSSVGASVAHDGALSWMVLSNTGDAALTYTVGVGGLPSAAATAGITWATTSTSLRTSSGVRSNPAVAHGNGKWLAVYRDGANVLRGVRSVLDSSPLAASVDVPLGIGTANSSPALAYGGGRFVLVFVDGLNLAARSSTDGVTWSAPATIFARIDPGPPGASNRSCTAPIGASIGFSDGAFHVVGRVSTTLCEGGTQAGGSRIVAFKSADGHSWSTTVDRNMGPPVVREEAGVPSGAFANCKLVTVYTQTRVNNAANPNHLVLHTATPSSCTAPASMTFGAPMRIPSAPSAQLDSHVAVVFGSG